MTLAVGRLQFSVRFVAPVRQQKVEEPVDTTLERAYRIDRRHQGVDAERQRWQTEALARAGRLF
jgi:hypothetical protein